MNVVESIGVVFLLILLVMVLGTIAAVVANIVVRIAFVFDEWLDGMLERRKKKCR